MSSSNAIRAELEAFYFQQGIHPKEFNCAHSSFCRTFAFEGEMTEGKMSLVGSSYGLGFPRIVVLSLDPPLGTGSRFETAEQRTTDYVSSVTEADDYRLNRPNVHWAMTQIIVGDVLGLFGYVRKTGVANVVRSYSGVDIENVTQFFAHVNAAKCSMNHPTKAQANTQVHRICSSSYLIPELSVLKPEILISQGASANTISGKLLGVEKRELPTAHDLSFAGASMLWLPMRHPARHTPEIRRHWPYYVQRIIDWKQKQKDTRP